MTTMWLITLVLRAYYAPVTIILGILAVILTLIVNTTSKQISGSNKIYSCAIALSDLGYLLFRACLLTWLGDGLRYSTGGRSFIYLDQLDLTLCKVTKLLGFTFEACSSWFLACECFEQCVALKISRSDNLRCERTAAGVSLALFIVLLCLVGIPCTICISITTNYYDSAEQSCTFDSYSSASAKQATNAEMVIIGLFDYLLPVLLLLATNFVFIRKLLHVRSLGSFTQEVPWPGVSLVTRNEAKYLACRTKAMLTKSVFNICLFLPSSLVYLLRVSPMDYTWVPIYTQVKDLLATLMTVVPLVNFLISFAYSKQFRSQFLSCFGRSDKPQQSDQLIFSLTSYT